MNDTTRKQMMKILVAWVTCTGGMLLSNNSPAQSGNMMNEGMWNAGWMGGYGGVWVPVVLIITVVAAVAWTVGRKHK
jgi:hypothetical protein